MTTTLSSITVALNSPAIKAQATEALREAWIHEDFLAEPSSVLWLKLADGKGIGIEKLGAAVLVSPGYFEGEFLLTQGLEGSEAFQLSREDAPQLMARVIRRAMKLEAGAQ